MNNIPQRDIIEAHLFWSACPDIGPVKLKLLIAGLGSAQAAQRASREELVAIVGEQQAEKISRFRSRWDAEKAFRLIEKWDVMVVTIEDNEYPINLRDIDDAPYLLYMKSRTPIVPAIFQSPAVAVVGSRKVTGYGRQVTDSIISGLVDAGVVIVSGLMYGVDETAHRAAIRNGGKTIGVWAGGLDTLWGTSREPLARYVLENDGLLLTEFPIGLNPTPGLFPARNRIVSGLAKGVAVIEAAPDSGSLITAGFAAQQGREVFSVPGPVTSPQSLGTAKLIQDGAMLVTNADDILNTLGLMYSTQRKTHQEVMASLESADQKKIYELLLSEQHSVDELVRITGWETARLTGILSLMELKGLIKDYGGLVFGLSP
jgi:DNA processing protein